MSKLPISLFYLLPGIQLRMVFFSRYRIHLKLVLLAVLIGSVILLVSHRISLVNDSKSEVLGSKSGHSDAGINQYLTEYQQKFNDLKSKNMLKGKLHYHLCMKNASEHERCIDPACSITPPALPSISQDNVDAILTPVSRVGVDKVRAVPSSFNVAGGEKKKYVFIMACSSDHFDESQTAIRQLHRVVFPHLSNYSFIYYDIGLQESQRQLLKDYGRAEVRQFPFSKFPRSRLLNCYTWKPLLIMAHIKQAEVVVWLDASIRFLKDILPLLKNVTYTGIFVGENNYLFSQHMTPTFFKYGDLGEELCQFSAFGEIETGFLIFHNEPFVHHLILEPWVACALDPNCMCPDSSLSMLYCPSKSRTYGKCHRYDQSVLGYILIRLFRHQRDTVTIQNPGTIYEINRYVEIKYLDDLQKSGH